MLPEGSSVAAAAQVISKDKVIIGRIRITCIQDHPSTEICQENFKTYQTSCFATMPRPSADAMKHFCKLLRSRMGPKQTADSWDGIIHLENKAADKSREKQDGAPLTDKTPSLPSDDAAAMKLFAKLFGSRSQLKKKEDSWDGIVDLKNKVTDEFFWEKQDGTALASKLHRVDGKVKLFETLEKLKETRGSEWAALAFFSHRTVVGPLPPWIQKGLENGPDAKFMTLAGAFILDINPAIKATVLQNGGIQLWFFPAYKKMLVTLSEELTSLQLETLLEVAGTSVGFRGCEIYANLQDFEKEERFMEEPRITMLVYPRLEHPWNCIRTAFPVLEKSAGVDARFEDLAIRWAWEVAGGKSKSWRYATILRLPSVNQVLVAFHGSQEVGKMHWMHSFQRPLQSATLEIMEDTMESFLLAVSISPS